MRFMIAYADYQDEEPNEQLEDNNTSCYGPFDVTEAPSCWADVSGDGVVDEQDVDLVAGYWRQSPGLPYDVDEDGLVTVVDMMLIAAEWGPCP